MDYFSFSRLESYMRCSLYYFYFYQTDLEKPPTDTVATVAGGVCHEVMEEFYGDAINREVAPLTLLDGVWNGKLNTLFLGGATFPGMEAPFFGHLKAIARDWFILSQRASAGYAGPDPIRNAKGEVPRKPQETSAWKAAAAQLGLDARCAVVDQAAAAQADVWRTVPLSQAFAESYAILAYYRDTLPALTVKHIEMPLSLTRESARKKGVPFPSDFKGLVYNEVRFPDGSLFNGYIDKVATDAAGKLYIIDHKSSKGGAPSVQKVANWEQLLLYGWAYHELHGVWPDYIGLNYLRDGALVLAPFNKAEAERAVRRAMSKIKGIKSNVFIERNPIDYDAPCLKGFGGQACPFLSVCHPSFVK